MVRHYCELWVQGDVYAASNGGGHGFGRGMYPGGYKGYGTILYQGSDRLGGGSVPSYRGGCGAPKWYCEAIEWGN